MRIRRALLVLACLVPAAAAQQVTLRGKVEDGPGNSFLVDCNGTLLTSSAFDLNAFVGQQVRLGGTWNGSASAPAVDVTSIATVPEIFEIPGNPTIGADIRFGASAPAGSRVVFFAALEPGFRPTTLPVGAFLLDPAGAVRAGGGVTNAVGRLEISIPLPNDPSLVGRLAYGQAAVVTGGSLVLSNPDCKDIES